MKISWPKGMERWKAVLDRYRYALLVIAAGVLLLLLPLALLRDDRVDVALVVELTQSGNYQGQTILPLREAYIDARLLCRPDSDWLDTSAAAAAGEED